MNEYILRAITNRTSLTPNMSADVDKAIAAQELAIKEARTREAINRKARLEAEVETQELVAGIKVPEGSTYSPSDIANSLKGIIANQTVAAAAIKRGDATEEQVRQYTEGKRYLGSLGETYGAMSYLVDEYTKTNRAKGSDGTIEGSIDPSSLIPQFAAGLDILNPNSAAKGNVSIESVYENGSYKTYQIFQSEKIREINKQMYEGEQNPEVRKKYLNENGEISDVYRMSYEDIKNIENDADGNIYEYGGLFSTVPGTSVVRDAAQKSNIFSKNNSSVTDEYMEAIPQQKTIDLNGRRVVVDRFIPNINAIASAIKPESDALTRTIFSGGRNAPYASFVKANSQKFGKGNFQVEEDGSIKVKLLKRDESGNYIVNEDGSYERDSEFTKIGSENLTDGRFNVASGAGSRYLGMSQEDFDKANRFTQDVSMIDLNLTQAGKEEINKDATKELNKKPTTPKEGKLALWERKGLNTDEVITSAIDAMPSEFVIKDLTSTSEEDVLKALEAQPEKVIESLSGMYPDFEFLNPINGLNDYIFVKSKRTGKKKKIEVNDGTGDNEGHYTTMTEWMKENAEPSGELEIKQQLESVLPNKSVVRIEGDEFKIKTPKVKSITTTEDGEKVIEYDYQELEDMKFKINDKDAIKKYLQDKLIGFNTDYLKGNQSSGGVVSNKAKGL